MFRKQALWFGLVISAGALSARADSVSGQFVLGGKPLKPAEVAAFRMRDQFDPRAYETYVMLTTKAVDKDKIRASIDPYAVAINDPAVSGEAGDYIALSISADGKTGLNAHVGGSNTWTRPARSWASRGP